MALTETNSSVQDVSAGTGPAIPMSMRIATLADSAFIAGQILNGARHGHFEKRLLVPEQTKLMQQELSSIIQLRRRANGSLGATAFVFHSGSTDIGHVILTDINGFPGLEIHTMAVDEKWQGQGFGGAMLDMLIARFLPQAGALYARCFPRTVIMYELLVSRGFRYRITLAHGARVLCLSSQPPGPPTF